jgi:cation transport ATPase
MALYIGRYALMLAGVAFLLWYSKSHTEEAGKTTIYFVLCTLPIALAWTVAETIAWNRDLRRGGLINKGTVLGVRQLPPE